MAATLRAHIDTLRRHPGCTAFLSVLTIWLVADAGRRHALGQATAYGGAIGLSVFIIDAALAHRPPFIRPYPVRSPRLELLVAASTAIAGFGYVVALFVIHYRPASILGRLVFVGVGLGSLVSVPLAAFLVARGYRPADLGLRASGIWLTLPVVAVLFCGLALAFTPGSVLHVFQARGSNMQGLATLLPLALAEEFFRVVWQTRVAAWRTNRALGWIVASCVWATLHGPVYMSGSGSMLQAATGVVDIIPVGLFFGYLIHRTGSIVPATLVHGIGNWVMQRV